MLSRGRGCVGTPAAEFDEFCEVAARFSRMVDALSGHLAEIDLNPVIVTSDLRIAVDALAVGKQIEE